MGQPCWRNWEIFCLYIIFMYFVHKAIELNGRCCVMWPCGGIQSRSMLGNAVRTGSPLCQHQLCSPIALNWSDELSWCFVSCFLGVLKFSHYRGRASWILQCSLPSIPPSVKHHHISFRNAISCFSVRLPPRKRRPKSHKNTWMFTTAFMSIVCMDYNTFFSL